jgi:hypothetical protein
MKAHEKIKMELYAGHVPVIAYMNTIAKFESCLEKAIVLLNTDRWRNEYPTRQACHDYCQFVGKALKEMRKRSGVLYN